MTSPPIVSGTVSIAGIETFVRRREGPGDPVVFVHGNPDSSATWVPFIERLDSAAIAFDLPGFGRSARPERSAFDHSMGAYARFFERALEVLAVDRYRLVVHDWGALTLAAAAREPARVSRLVIANGVPLLAGYRWHWLGRVWRRRGLGEAFNALNTKPATALLLRRSRPRLRPMPGEFVDQVWSAWDRGMDRAILGLYRSGDPAALERFGRDLDRLECPAKIVWGSEDPFISPSFGRLYAERLPNAELRLVEAAGHWPWVDRPALIDEIVGFLEA